MVKVYRGKFMEKFLRFLANNKLPIELSLRRKLYDKNWVIYAKQPFKNAEGVVEYLGRYSHKIAISNHRIKGFADNEISFSFKDYAHGSVTKIMKLEPSEFLRRFCMHILPPKFVKIRHYGFLSSRAKVKLKVHQMKTGILPDKSVKLSYAEITKRQLGFDVEQCPCCKKGRMIIVLQFGANGPPPSINDKHKKQIMN
jgi:hypothetical protein